MSVESALHKVADALGMHYLHEEITKGYERPEEEAPETDPNKVAKEQQKGGGNAA
jgi:hypothetical protein